MPGVLTWKPGSIYKDRIEAAYAYPSDYDGEIRTIGSDWFVYHRSRRSGLKPGYIGVARITGILPYPEKPDWRVAEISDFLSFDPFVPFNQVDRSARETWLRAFDVKDYGKRLRGKSVRLISNEDFGAIVRAGLADLFDPEKTALLDLDDPELIRDGIELLNLPFEEQIRRMREIIMKRPIREAAFRRDVRKAYDFKCAFTGLSIRNGGGRPEVDGAHIWGVKEGGPDVVQNGIAVKSLARMPP